MNVSSGCKSVYSTEKFSRFLVFQVFWNFDNKLHGFFGLVAESLPYGIHCMLVCDSLEWFSINWHKLKSGLHTEQRKQVCFKHLLTCSIAVLISYIECTLIPAYFCQHTDTFTWIKHWCRRNDGKNKPPVISLHLFLQNVSELNQPSESLLFISSLVCVYLHPQ